MQTNKQNKFLKHYLLVEKKDNFYWKGTLKSGKLNQRNYSGLKKSVRTQEIEKFWL